MVKRRRKSQGAGAEPGAAPVKLHPWSPLTRAAAAFLYGAREASFAFRRNGLMSLAAVTTIMVTLVLVGWGVVLTVNLRRLASAVEGQVEVVAYLRDGIEKGQRERVVEQVRRVKGVGRITFVGRDQALARLQASLGERIPLEDIVINNPLPDSIEVEVVDTEEIRRIGAAVRRIPGVEDVGYGVQVLDRLLAVTALLRWGGVLATALLATVALIIIMNTIRLTILGRRTEIEIMQLVGASGWFVRSPFLLEGAFAGLVATCCAAMILVPGYVFLFTRAQRLLPFLPIVPAGELLPLMLVMLLAGGILVGMSGSMLALRRFIHATSSSVAAA